MGYISEQPSIIIRKGEAEYTMERIYPVTKLDSRILSLLWVRCGDRAVAKTRLSRQLQHNGGVRKG